MEPAQQPALRAYAHCTPATPAKRLQAFGECTTTAAEIAIENLALETCSPKESTGACATSAGTIGSTGWTPDAGDAEAAENTDGQGNGQGNGDGEGRRASQDQAGGGSAGVTVLVMNLSNSSRATLQLEFPDLGLSAVQVAGLLREEYIFTSAAAANATGVNNNDDIDDILLSQSVLLNGQLLRSTGSAIPPLPPRVVPPAAAAAATAATAVDLGAAGHVEWGNPTVRESDGDTDPISLAPLSYGYIVFPTLRVAACS